MNFVTLHEQDARASGSLSDNNIKRALRQAQCDRPFTSAKLDLKKVGFYQFEWDVHEIREVVNRYGLVFCFLVEDLDIV